MFEDNLLSKAASLSSVRASSSMLSNDIDIGDACAAMGGTTGSSRGQRDTNSDNHRHCANVEQKLDAPPEDSTALKDLRMNEYPLTAISISFSASMCQGAAVGPGPHSMPHTATGPDGFIGSIGSS